MKKQVLITFIVILLVIPFVNAQVTTPIPDPNFEQALIDLEMDSGVIDGVVLTQNILDVTYLDVSGKNINLLTGIAAFSSLETLICSNNNLLSLDVSSNSNLTTLSCGINQLSALDVRLNTLLEVLDFTRNQISELILQENNVAFNPNLERLTCSNNQLQSIDVSENLNLKSLSVSGNQISGELLVSNNVGLENLFCASNQITLLDLSANGVLKNLDASNNLISNLDLSAINTVLCPSPQTNPSTACQAEGTINVSKNSLVSLIINNTFNSLFSIFNATNNPNLKCIQIDNGFTPPTTGVFAWKKDDWAYYTAGVCADIYTYVPDDKFEEALIALGHDSGAIDNLVLTSTISVLTDLPISGQSISDLTGIEDFIALTSLNCSNNDLKTIDLSANVNLTTIDCSINILPDLDVSANTLLENLYCSAQTPYIDADDSAKDYTFTNLNISNNAALLVLNCANNNLALLNVNSNTALTNLDCSFNTIEALDVSANVDLTRFLCNNNSLFALNLNNGNNTALTEFNADGNPNLSCIEVEAIPVPVAGWTKDVNSSYSLACGTYVPDDAFETYLETHTAAGGVVLIGDITSMGDGAINNFVTTTNINAVTTLNVATLGIGDFTGIEAFLGLVDLNCSNNSIANLDVSNNTALTTIDCSSNVISNLDFSLNTALTDIDCNDNNLQTLSLKNIDVATLNQFDAAGNPNLYCIEVDNLALANAKPIADWKKDNTAVYSVDCAGRVTAIIDDNFEQALIDLGLDSGPLDDQVLTSNIEHLLNLDVNDKNIADLSGIQGFSGLKELDCSGNSLSELNVSNMVYLELLNCNSNYLLTNNSTNPTGVLNTDGANNLKRLFCASNLLADLDVSNKLLLEELDCGDNNISILDITANPELSILNCSNNSLLGLNISQNIKLEDLNCDNNQITNFTTAGTINTTLKKLSCAYNNIGILDVTNYSILETLKCQSNQLSQLNVTSNPALITLDFTSNSISEIDLVNNTNLETALVSHNNLTELDVSINTLLKTLKCDNNQIDNLIIDNAVALKYLHSSGNKLTDLDVSNNINLIELNVSSNNLSTIALAANLSNLKTFNCSDNNIVSYIDLSTMGTTVCPPASTDPNNPQDYCPEKISINVSGNLLSVLNIQNSVNSNISALNASNNPDLDCIQVDDANNIGAGWLKSATATYSVSCRFGETYVPDNNFETRLIALGYDTLPLDDYVLTSQIDALTSLDVNGESIADLTGIEDFIALETLDCSNNVLTNLDLKKNTALTSINCSNNDFLTLDFSNNIVLTTINCSDNELTKLDVTANVNLLNLNISNNNFSKFLPSTIPTLEDLNCDSNLLTNLDLSSNSALTALSCELNVLETLNLKNGQNTNLSDLNAQNNTDLTCIETDTGDAPSGVTWLKDATTEYQIDCHYGLTYVPDDAFEQALIDKGIDLGVLDDYVPTNRIENFLNLDISNRSIKDLTGIEDFISLKVLNFSNNILTEVDLSKNSLLENLNASTNLLTEIDLSFNTNLKVVNISGNSIAEIDLNSNANLLVLNISNNQLAVLNVDALVDLQTLNCSSNSLESLSIQLNPQMLNLYCQSNSFISDQLNLQNGANQNLANFNATDNGDLKCILVDDPFKVITNAGGVYDNWFKDFASNYQSVCIDADNDGVNNEDDLCPNSVFGQPVNLFGCEYLNLPNNNFSVLITGETCLNSNNGKINITANEIYNYTATVTSDDFPDPFLTEFKFTNDVEIRNLLAGTYKMCITIEEWPDYISCYDIVINHPEKLAVLTNKRNSSKKVALELSGNSSYNIDVNELRFTANTNVVTLNLNEGENTIKVSTDLECQGVYEESIFVSNQLFVHPNPFSNQIQVYLGDVESDATVNIHSYLGQLVYSKTFIEQENQNLVIDSSLFSDGFYSISIKTKASLSTFKIVKK